MLTIRLFRIGKKKQPSYKIVVTDKKNPPRAGRFVDEVGYYNPITKEKKIDGEKVKHWISNGASLSDTVHNLMVSEGIVDDTKREKYNISKREVKEETPVEETAPEEPSAEAPAEETKEEVKEEIAVEETAPEEVKEEAPVEEVKEEASTEEAAPEEIKDETPTEDVKEEETLIEKEEKGREAVSEE